MPGFSIATLASIASLVGSGIKNVMDTRQKRSDMDAAHNREIADLKAIENESMQDRSDVRSAMALKQRMNDRITEKSANTAKITGATPEATTALKGKIAESDADMMANIAAQQAKRKDNARMAQIETNKRYDALRQAEDQAAINSDLNLGTQALQIAGAGIDGMLASPETTPTPTTDTTPTGTTTSAVSGSPVITGGTVSTTPSISLTNSSGTVDLSKADKDTDPFVGTETKTVKTKKNGVETSKTRTYRDDPYISASATFNVDPIKANTEGLRVNTGFTGNPYSPSIDDLREVYRMRQKLNQ